MLLAATLLGSTGCLCLNVVNEWNTAKKVAPQPVGRLYFRPPSTDVELLGVEAPAVFDALVGAIRAHELAIASSSLDGSAWVVKLKPFVVEVAAVVNDKDYAHVELVQGPADARVELWHSLVFQVEQPPGSRRVRLWASGRVDVDRRSPAELQGPSVVAHEILADVVRRLGVVAQWDMIDSRPLRSNPSPAPGRP